MQLIKFPLLTAIAIASISSALAQSNEPTSYSRGFLYKISTGELSDVVYNSTETSLRGISGSFIIGNTGDWSNPLSTNTGFLTNVVTHETRVINVPGSIGGSSLTAIGGNMVAGYYYFGETNVARNFLYNINTGAYTTNITFTNTFPWAGNASFYNTSETFSVAGAWFESNSVTTNISTYYNGFQVVTNDISTSTNTGNTRIIVYNISNGSSTLLNYPAGYSYISYNSAGISSNLVVAYFYGEKNGTNWSGYTNGSFIYNASNGTYRELPSINGNRPYASAISGNVILGTWSERDYVNNTNRFYLFTYSTTSNSYIATNIPPVLGVDEYPASIQAFEGNFVVGTRNLSTNSWNPKAYLYDMSQPMDSNNPVVPNFVSTSAIGISGGYMIGEWYSTNPITAPSYSIAPVVSSGGGSISKKKSAKKSALKSTKKSTVQKATKKKSAKKRK